MNCILLKKQNSTSIVLFDCNVRTFIKASLTWIYRDNLTCCKLWKWQMHLIGFLQKSLCEVVSYGWSQTFLSFILLFVSIFLGMKTPWNGLNPSSRQRRFWGQYVGDAKIRYRYELDMSSIVNEVVSQS